MKILGLVLLASCSSIRLFGQSEATAIALTSLDNREASARCQALSGAMGAVGADLSSAIINPAGIALLKHYGIIEGTIGYSMTNDQSSWYSASQKDRRSPISFDNFAVGLPMYQDITMSLNFNKRGGINRTLNLSVGGLNPYEGSSLADFAGALMNKNNPALIQKVLEDPNADIFTGDTYLPWLGSLAYGAEWINYSPKQAGQDAQYYSNYIYKDSKGKERIQGANSLGLTYNEKSSIYDLDMNIGWALSPKFYIGASMTMSTLQYTVKSFYHEGFHPNKKGQDAGFLELQSRQSIHGTGSKVGLGVLSMPIKGLRLGASVFTPTYYLLKYDFGASARGLSPVTQSPRKAIETPSNAATSFMLATPWTATLSLAYFYKQKGFISFDYELQSFTNSCLSQKGRFSDEENVFNVENEAISKDFQASHCFRLGAEFKVNKQLALRLGANLQSSRLAEQRLASKKAEAEFYVVDIAPTYMIPGKNYGFSTGIGYRLTPKWSFDLAYSYKVHEAKFYAFPAINDEAVADKSKAWLGGLEAIDWSRSRNHLALTISYHL